MHTNNVIILMIPSIFFYFSEGLADVSFNFMSYLERGMFFGEGVHGSCLIILFDNLQESIR